MSHRCGDEIEVYPRGSLGDDVQRYLDSDR